MTGHLSHADTLQNYAKFRNSQNKILSPFCAGTSQSSIFSGTQSHVGVAVPRQFRLVAPIFMVQCIHQAQFPNIESILRMKLFNYSVQMLHRPMLRALRSRSSASLRSATRDCSRRPSVYTPYTNYSLEALKIFSESNSFIILWRYSVAQRSQCSVMHDLTRQHLV